MRKRQPEGGLTGLGGSPVSGGSVRRLGRVHARAAVEQGRGVGVGGGAVDRVDRADLDDPAEIHHQHPVGDVMHDVQVVADEQVGQAELLPSGRSSRFSTCASHRFVQRGDRLVQDQQAGLQRQGAGDVDALALAAGQLVRVAAGELRRVEADRASSSSRARPRAAARCMPCTCGRRRCSSPMVRRGFSEA